MGALSGIFGGRNRTLFEYCGFYDRNKNGVIEKTPWYKPWKSEGYRSGADADADGKITEEEAKFYLYSLDTFSQEIRDKFPLTDNKKASFKAAISDSMSRNRTISPVRNTYYLIGAAKTAHNCGLGREIVASYLFDALDNACHIRTSALRNFLIIIIKHHLRNNGVSSSEIERHSRDLEKNVDLR
jgi:hypothetical protein